VVVSVETARRTARANGTSVNQFIIDALASEIQRLRENDEFQARLRRLVEDNKAILDRLAQ
ncbi:MAG: hypothetical protein ACO2Z4_09895, partial [Ilumatobacteraceae bacterium]